MERSFLEELSGLGRQIALISRSYARLMPFFCPIGKAQLRLEQ